MALLYPSKMTQRPHCTKVWFNPTLFTLPVFYTTMRITCHIQLSVDLNPGPNHYTLSHEARSDLQKAPKYSMGRRLSDSDLPLKTQQDLPGPGAYVPRAQDRPQSCKITPRRPPLRSMTLCYFFRHPVASMCTHLNRIRIFVCSRVRGSAYIVWLHGSDHGRPLYILLIGQDSHDNVQFYVGILLVAKGFSVNYVCIVYVLCNTVQCKYTLTLYYICTYYIFLSPTLDYAHTRCSNAPQYT